MRHAVPIDVSSCPVMVGRIAQVTPEDVALVDFPGNVGEPIPARVAAEVPACADKAWPPVLLTFENGDLRLPIIVGFVRDQLRAKAPESRPARVKKLVLDAEDEVLLQCGKSSILLRDGKITITGPDILSRASRVNKIQGSAVKLN